MSEYPEYPAMVEPFDCLGRALTEEELRALLETQPYDWPIPASGDVR